MKTATTLLLGGLALGALSGCRTESAETGTETAGTAVPRSVRSEGVSFVVRDTTLESYLEATGTAAPRLSADLSTRLMGKVLTVSVKEGDRVREGQALVQIDGRDLEARSEGLASGLEAARSQLALAQTQARRLRALYADSAIPKSALDQALAELDRAKAGLSQVQSQESELRTNQGYTRLVAPFAGRIVSRRVDPGMMATPGAPLVRVEDASVLRVSATTTTATARALRPGTAIQVRVDGHVVAARIEGIVPSGAGTLAVVNALVDNRADTLPRGAVAPRLLPRGPRAVRWVPAAALSRQGDLVGVRVRTPQGDLLRWIRTGSAVDAGFEVLSGVDAGDTVVIQTNSVNGKE